jgi:hypothetical protein
MKEEVMQMMRRKENNMNREDSNTPIGAACSKNKTTPKLLPVNLADEIGEFNLVARVIKAVAEANENWQTKPIGAEGNIYPAPMLASVLVYSYATGHYGSHDIESLISKSPALSYICRGRMPDWNSIRKFRRRNLQALHVALSNLFLEILKERSQSKQMPPETLELVAKSEADARLRIAIQTDTAVMDE